jgi:mannose-1-phosphate guanylyltransferase
VGYHILVLAGGSGTRLWPLSREATPKHLLPLDASGRTLLRATVERVLPLADSVRVVTAASQAGGCRQALAGLPLPPDPIIAEPEARGTGPALGLATAWIAAHDPEAVVSSVHADHDVEDGDGYRAAVLAAAGWAAATRGLATVGIAPTHPATGLGYVALAPAPLAGDLWRPPPGSRASAEMAAVAAAVPAFPAEQFVEKPSLEVARSYLEGGRHLWNSGLFAWTADVFLEELRSADPTMGGTLAAAVAARDRGDEGEVAARYGELRAVPVDTLVFERTRRLTVVRGWFSWSDLGSFTDLYEARCRSGEADDQGNVAEGPVLGVDARHNFVVARGGRTVVLVGVEDLAVIDSGDALLVVPLSQTQRVREVTGRLREEGRSDLL